MSDRLVEIKAAHEVRWGPYGYLRLAIWKDVDWLIAEVEKLRAEVEKQQRELKTWRDHERIRRKIGMPGGENRTEKVPTDE